MSPVFDDLFARRYLRRAAVCAGVALAAAVLLGCGGDSTEPTSAVKAVVVTPTAESGGPLPLERYHYVASLTLLTEKAGGEASKITVSTRGDVQSDERHALTYTIKRGDGTVRRDAVIIGDIVWIRERGGAWRSATMDDADVVALLAVAYSPARPGFLGGEQFRLVRESVGQLTPVEEPVNDVPALRYRVGSEGADFFQTFIANEPVLADTDNLEWDLWLAEDGAWPVRLRASGSVTAGFDILEELEIEAPATWELRIDISRPDDPTLTVNAPEDGD